MKFGILAGYVIAGLYTLYLAFWIDAASPQVIAVYIAASLAALALSTFEPVWAARTKWSWVVLSLLVIIAIVSGPLDYLRLG